jgi:hypothetical protein
MKVGEGLDKVCDEMIFAGGLDDHVVNVGFDVLQTKVHDLVAVDVVGHYECCFVLVVRI